MNFGHAHCTCILEMRVRVKGEVSQAKFFREIIYGYYTSYNKACKDITELYQYCQEREYELLAYRVFGLSDGYCMLHKGESFHKTTEEVISMLTEHGKNKKNKKGEKKL